MTLIVAGERSGVGKTTITLAILSYLKKHNSNIQSFKVGPDYIDPMFHHYVTGKPCYNLDSILTSESYIKACYNQHIQTCDYGLIEGVMGLFDGIPNGEKVPIASTAQIALILDLPVILVLDCSRLSGSIAAIALGFKNFNPDIKLEGLVLNKVGSDRHLELLKAFLEPVNIPIIGIIKRQENIVIPDRHLGLIPTNELPQMDLFIQELAELAQTWFDWEKLLPLLKNTLISDLSNSVKRENSIPTLRFEHNYQPIRIAIAKDAAFNFYYADNLEILQQLGAELIEWSPLKDEQLPTDIKGLYFGGGFPEVFAQELSQNQLILNAVKTAILSGIPTYAECGGLMYLCEKIIDFENNAWSMVGILPTTAVMGKRLKLGYYQAKVLKNTPLLLEGEIITGHEFHRSELIENPSDPLYEMQRFMSSQTTAPVLEGWGNFSNVHGSYLHLHWGNRIDIPTRFLKSCTQLSSYTK
ncbi:MULTISPECIES: cobyrinate a,c-diamide synthase [Planktothrix]|jgi:cobyrinic acid a,c-diamide synthase|uniref:Cobyrinate a,c-diamide synthase n=2 Tax=Planktothrix TaxID=54304 RepID=A0A073CN07_PLAA1|nr:MULTISPECIES: cobyrinate a,c-diamide synthase [Planktothrix]KEI65335.1 CobB [Planktothrix agardhii NIVA-CYA 126/8]MCB8762250.1 cobyrinate a,c-diamide synthase [Planktothrix agardhii 1809]MCB8775948.1 cobyrinate a,c-diamide synthase [Planktothrix agardhii 1031]MCB8780371.1 cobyrinate a,c-diamide synthase [Planktothrix agardhii 1808]MCF3568437.1 cobyrinate a,c-diamide synthase [Planktothrix agardhii 1807]